MSHDAASSSAIWGRLSGFWVEDQMLYSDIGTPFPVPFRGGLVFLSDKEIRYVLEPAFGCMAIIEPGTATKTGESQRHEHWDRAVGGATTADSCLRKSL